MWCVSLNRRTARLKFSAAALNEAPVDFALEASGCGKRGLRLITLLKPTADANYLGRCSGFLRNRAARSAKAKSRTRKGPRPEVSARAVKECRLEPARAR